MNKNNKKKVEEIKEVLYIIQDNFKNNWKYYFKWEVFIKNSDTEDLLRKWLIKIK